MLKNEVEDLDLKDIKEDLKQYLPDEVQAYFKNKAEETHIHFPVKSYPQKLKSLNLSKAKDYSGKLKGIKGQYLIFEDDTVFNVRNHSGFVIDVQLS